MQKNNNYKGYSLFHDIEDAALRTWNRCVVMLNINKDLGENFVKGYGECMSPVERMQMMAMYQYIAVKGTDAVLAEIRNGMHTSEDKVVH
jgi:hypothetical protein